jgi:DNA (cytosine-5)-methyltransferase 1
MSRPLLLDLFSGAGGAAVGYHQAGFDVIGVDNRAQKRYPFPFIQADALEFLASAKLDQFALIHASPPCQAYSITRNIHKREHPQLIDPVRALLKASGKPYVIENVMGAPLINPVMLCGLMFGLRVFRHRLFETNPAVLVMPHAIHGKERIGEEGMVTVVEGGCSNPRQAPRIGFNGFCCVAGHGDGGRGRISSDHRHVDRWKKAMNISWMTRDELSQAVPPAYTEYLGMMLR